MGGGECIVVWYFIVMENNLSQSEQFDEQVKLLTDYYKLYDDDEYIDKLRLDDVIELITKIETQYAIIKSLVDFAGVRSRFARQRILTNMGGSRTQYHHAGGMTIEDELFQMEMTNNINTKHRTDRERKLYATRRKHTHVGLSLIHI